MLLFLGADLKGTLLYKDHLLSTVQAKHLVAAFECGFGSVVESKHDYVVGQIEFFSGADKELLQKWNHRTVAVPETCLHDMIADHCRSRPDSLNARV